MIKNKANYHRASCPKQLLKLETYLTKMERKILRGKEKQDVQYEVKENKGVRDTRNKIISCNTLLCESLLSSVK